MATDLNKIGVLLHIAEGAARYPSLKPIFNDVMDQLTAIADDLGEAQDKAAAEAKALAKAEEAKRVADENAARAQAKLKEKADEEASLKAKAEAQSKAQGEVASKPIERRPL